MRRCTITIVLLLIVHGMLSLKAAAEDFKIGGITVSEPWARATPGGAKIAGAYLEVRAAEGVEDRLIAVKSPASGVVELHDHISDGGVMRMRRVDAIAIKGMQAVVLKPGGQHVMLMELKAPLVAGEHVEMTLVFEKAGELTIRSRIASIGAQNAPDAGSGSGSGSGSGKN